MVAECMGHLALLFPAEVLPALQQRQSDRSPSTRAAVVTAIKYAVVPQPHPIDALLHSSIPPFLDLISDPDRCVRGRAAETLCLRRPFVLVVVCIRAVHLPFVCYQQEHEIKTTCVGFAASCARRLCRC